MKFCSISKSKLLFLAGLFMFSTVGVVQAKECDMSDSVAAGDSAAVRADCPDQKTDLTVKEHFTSQKKQKPKSTMGAATAKPDNSRFSTDGTERPDDLGAKGQGYSDTGPKR
jgi:hypothetical protein